MTWNIADFLPHTESLVASFDWPTLIEHNQFKCPSCDSIVYSRKTRFCGVCGENLPKEFLFTSHETRKLQNLLQIEKQKHRQWLLKHDDHAWNLLPAQ
jgi:hypothetical protein